MAESSSKLELCSFGLTKSLFYCAKIDISFEITQEIIVVFDKTERNNKAKNDKTERKNLCVFDKTERNVGYSIRNFLPRKNLSTLHYFRYLIEHKCFTTERFAVQTFQQPVTNYTPPFLSPYSSAPIARRIFFALPVIFFPACLTFFIICVEKVCYKLCNMYYKLCNMRYKLSNMCYKVCNKNFLIGQEKLSCRS